MLPICPFQFRVFVDQTTLEPDFKVSIPEILQKQIKLAIFATDHLQYPLHRILVLLNALLASPWRSYPIFHVGN
jgi:hypothetical protein